MYNFSATIIFIKVAFLYKMQEEKWKKMETIGEDENDKC